VWAAKAEWVSNDLELSPRIAELAIRAAAICKSFSGGGSLTAKDLGPAQVFAAYQTRIRRILKPNEGENLEGKIALKILAYLDRLNGAFVSKRKMLMDLHAYRFGPSVADRPLAVLHANDEIEVTQKRPYRVRRIGSEHECYHPPV
jgi:hypothetical protein